MRKLLCMIVAVALASLMSCAWFDIDVGRGAPDQVVAAGMKLSHAVFPAENVVYSGYEWVIRPIRESEVSVLLAVKVNGEDRFYTVAFKVESLGK